MFYKNNKFIQRRTFSIFPLFILLILIGTFTIIPSFGQNNNLDWNQICNTVELALYNSCDEYVNSSGQLTYEGERAMGCIRNGLLIGGAAAGLNVPLGVIIPGLDMLAGMTGCDGIVKLDLLSTIGNPSQLLDMFTQMPSQNIVTETLSQKDVGENTRPENDVSENTIPQKSEFLLFNNELFSVYYPSDWEYEEFRYLDEPNVIFRDTNYPGGDVIQISTYKNDNTTLDDLISNITQQLKQNPSNKDIQTTDVSTKNIYLGNYPAVKFNAEVKVNSELNYFQKQKMTEYTTIANGKQYVLMLWSNPSQSTETNPIFERMVSSFDILPIRTDDSKSSFENNDQKYSWDSTISDGIVTYKVNSSDLKFRNMVDSAFNEWEEKLSSLVVFEKIKYGNADITFQQVQNLTPNKLDKNEIEIDNGVTILNISNSSLIDNVKINILEGMDIDELEKNVVIKHEIGHALGLIHSENENSTMYPSSANYENQEITFCDAYQVHIINFGKDSDSPIDKNECNSIENNQNNFSNTMSQNNKIAENFSVYENSTFGIKINYPKNWTIDSQKEEYPLTNVAIFYSPENKDYVEVHIDTFDYSNIQIESLRELLNDAIDGFTVPPNDFPEFKLLRTSLTSTDNLADMPAYVLEGDYKDPEFGKQMILEQGMIKDNINYYIRYFASPSQYQNYLDDVETMIQSFKIQK